MHLGDRPNGRPQRRTSHQEDGTTRVLTAPHRSTPYSAVHDVYERPIPADLVTLVAEVVSPSTKRKDRRKRPALYAAAGIRHYWRVETDQTAPAFAIYTYELDDAVTEYIATGVHHDRVTATQPFTLDIDLKPVHTR